MSHAPYPWQLPQWQQQVEKLRQGLLPQSLLLTGPPGIGKADFAREFARLALCQEATDVACGQCGACRTFAAGSQADWIEVRRAEDKNEIRIDQIREFCADIQLTANTAKGRYALIHEADKLNRAAANALLKTLEEPPSGVHILLTAQQLSRIPATIRSRCSRVTMSRPGLAAARDWLGADYSEVADSLIDRLGPVRLVQQKEQLADLSRQQQDWCALMDNLKKELDPLKAAAAIDDSHFDSFLNWWQSRLLQGMKANHQVSGFQRLWDALLRVRRQGQGGSINRLLALEGLFILYTELVQQARQ